MKNMSRYCNKDIKMKLIKTILVTLLPKLIFLSAETTPLLCTNRNTSSVSNKRDRLLSYLLSINSLMCFLIYGKLITENHG